MTSLRLFLLLGRHEVFVHASIGSHGGAGEEAERGRGELAP